MSRRALPLVLTAAICGLSVSGPLAKLSDAPALAIAVWRVGIACAAVAAILAVQGSWREWRGLSRRDLAIALGAGFVLALHFWSWIASLDYTTVAASVVLVNLHPVVIVLGSVLWLGERPSRGQVAGLAVAMTGAAVIGLADARGIGSEGSPPNPLLGDALAILGAVTVGLYYLAGRSLRQRLSLWPYVGLVYGACLVSLVAMAVLAGTPLLGYPAREWGIFAGTALGPMLLGHTGFNWSLRYLPAYVVSAVILLEPIGASVISALLPGIREVPGPWVIVGGVVVLAGLLVGTLAGRGSNDLRSADGG